MKKLILQSLELTNFKGQSFKLETKGKNVNIFGDNATGKTTLFDAFTWLITGKDSAFKSAFEIKNRDHDGNEAHNLEHTVKGLFRWDGKVIELKKVYAEIWTKKRGSVSKEFSGHTTDHFIDSVPVTKSEYQDFVSSIVIDDQFKLLTNPFYFPEKMKWTDRRALLLDMCGDVTDQDVIGSNTDLKQLDKILAGRKFEDHKKVIVAKRKEINDQLDKIPVRIDEVVKGMPDVSAINHLREIEKIKKLQDEKDQVEKKIFNLKNNGAISELERDLSKKQTELDMATNAIKSEHDANLQGVKRKVFSLTTSIENHESAIIRAEKEIEYLLQDKKRGEMSLENLREEWAEIGKKDKDFKVSLHNGQCTCGVCGDVHDMPADKVASMLASHNEKLSKGKEENVKNGKAEAKRITEIDMKIAGIRDSNAEAQKLIDTLKEELKNLEASSDDPADDIINLILESSDEVKELKESIAAISARIGQEVLGVADTEKLAEYEQQGNAISESITDAQNKVALVEQSQKAQDRKAELEKDQKSLATEFEKLEGELCLMEEFTRAKVGMLEEKINSMFKMARFTMFENQINGGLSECCKVTFNGVPFESSLNNGARINVGLDIINTLSDHVGISVPVFCDNAESVTNIIDMESQIIRLVVSDSDKTLRVEVK